MPTSGFSALRTALVLTSLVGCHPRSSVRFTAVPERGPRTSPDTFGRVEFVLRTLDREACEGCTIWLRWVDRPGDTGASGARRITRGTIGPLGSGPYQLVVEAPGLMRLVRQLDLPPRHTIRAEVRMVPSRR